MVACSDGPSPASEAPAGIELARSALAREEEPSRANLGALAAGNQAFAFDLYHQIAASDPHANLVFSPHSVSTALAMTYAGARGETAAALSRTLHFTLPPPALHEAFNALDGALSSRGRGAAGADGTPFRLNVDNALWAQRGVPIEQTFLDTLALHYGAGVFLADFVADPEGARRSINRWVAERTEKLVPELLRAGSIRGSTRFVLTNTVYFNASWKTQFEKGETRPAPFTKRDASVVSAETMHAVLTVPYAEGPGYRAVALPYASEELRFIAILPDPGALAQIEAAFSETWLARLEGALSDVSVALALPKLDYKAHTSLKKQLSELGLASAFEQGDFSGMTSQPTSIDDVIHEAVIRLFESGTIAAAATAVTFGDSDDPEAEQTLSFDRPFLFAIVDVPTGACLFVGRVLDPTAS